MSRAHAAEKIHADQGDQANCHCFAHAVTFKHHPTTWSLGPTKAVPAMKVPLHQPHLLASGMISKKRVRREDRAHDDYFAGVAETCSNIERTSDFNNPVG